MDLKRIMKVYGDQLETEADRLLARFSWKPIDGDTPKDRFLMVRGPSGYVGTKHRVMVAKFDRDYVKFAKDGDYRYCWRTHANDSVLDDGEMITEWMELIP